MNDAIRMFLVVVGVTTCCGLLLAGAHDFTKPRIEEQHIRYVKGPAVRAVLTGADNDPLADRIPVAAGDTTILLFPGKSDGVLTGVAIEADAQGYGGTVEVVTGFDPVSGVCTGIAIAGATETPGIGSRIVEPSFTQCFKGLACTTRVALRGSGGTIDGVSGATISSKAVCTAVGRAQEIFLAVRDTISEAIK